MKSCGVIVEYNPFHNGHLYHLQQAKKITGADVIIAVMSGNFLQRGEPAIVDKWTRAQMALSGGADLIIELPTAFCIQPADYFAKGGISLLQAIGCDQLCFGVESGEAEDFQKLAECLADETAEIEKRFKEVRNNGMTYAAQMQQIIADLFPSKNLDLSMPNSILGLAYAKENAKYANPMVLHTVKRSGSGYHEQEIMPQEKMASATAIRKTLREDTDLLHALNRLKEVIPETTAKALANAELVSWETFWPYLKYQLTIQSVVELRTIYQMNEGIEYRLKEKSKEAKNFGHFISLVKNKRYTWVRLQRLCLYILLNVKTEEMMEELQSPKAVHILGFNKKGQAFLNHMKKESNLPLLNNIQQKNSSLWQFDIKAGEVYNLGFSALAKPQDFRRQPLRQK